MSTPGEWCTPTPRPAPEAPYEGTLAEAAVGNSLCSTGWSAYLLTGFLVDFLVRHFASPLNVETPDLRSLVWSPGDRTGILIEEESRWRPQTTEKRPAVIVKRNAYRSVRLGRANLAGYNNGTGSRFYAKLWSGSHTLFCLHRSGAGADLLATEVVNEVGRFAHALQGALGLHYLEVVEVGPASEVEEATESRAVPVTVGWVYEDTWEVVEEAPPLRRVSLRRLLNP